MSKSFYIHSSLRSVKNRYKLLKVYSRKSTILPIHVGLTVLIYNGKIFQKKRILYGMIGHKFGEFALTRKINTQRNKN